MGKQASCWCHLPSRKSKNTFEMPKYRCADMRVYELANLDAAIFQIELLRRFRGIWTSAVRMCMTTGIDDPSNKNF